MEAESKWSAIDPGRGLQSLHDRARQDVHQERFGPRLLGSECHQRRIALLGEGREEHEGDRAGTDDVESQHRGREPDRDIGVGEEQLAQDARDQKDHQERDEPANGLTDLEEDERSERSQDAP